MAVRHVLRRYRDSERQRGSPLGVLLAGSAIPPERRQPLAAELGFSEPLCRCPDTASCDLHPAADCPSRPSLVARLALGHHRSGCDAANPPAGAMLTGPPHDDEVWIRAPPVIRPTLRLTTCCGRHRRRHYLPPHPDQDADQFWACLDQRPTVRPESSPPGRSPPDEHADRFHAARRTPRSLHHHPHGTESSCSPPPLLKAYSRRPLLFATSVRCLLALCRPLGPRDKSDID